MRARERDRRASEAGGFVVDSGSDPARGTAEALVVLADGSVWRGWTTRTSPAAAGEVRVVGDVALVGAEGRLSGLVKASFQAHLASARSADRGIGIRGCLTAAGATSPLHAKVALAVVRGEIGRP
jgi:hypothetical protein